MNETVQKPKILIVDDAPENIWTLIENLEKTYEVMYATSGEDGLEIAFSDDPPDLILLDIIMPGMDGYQVIKQLKGEKQTCDIPVIFLTAKTDDEDETEGFRLGAWDYITKPFSMPVVKARIQSVINLKREMDRRFFLKTQMERLNLQLESQVQQKIEELQEARNALDFHEKKYRLLFEKSDKITPSRKKILIVDDNPENIHLLSDNLEEDYEILYATDGKDALETVFSGDHPDLILLDIMMPGLDGYEVCGRLKANAETWEIPIIFITAMNREDDETKGLKLGAIDYISKPFSMAVVRARISTALRLQEEMDRRIMLTQQLKEMNQDLENRVNEQVVELRQAHEALKESESRYRSIFENAVEGIFQVSLEGNMLDASPSMARILGYDSSEELISSVTDVATQCYFNPDDRSTLLHLLAQAPDGVVRGYETRMKKKDGSIIWVSFSIRFVSGDRGQTLFTEGFCMDITGQKETEKRLRESEKQLRQAQKMEAIGTLAGGIAHDFNNILHPIMGHAELLSKKLPDASPFRKHLEQIQSASRRAKKLVEQILTFSRQQPGEVRLMGIQHIAKEVINLVRSSIPANINIRQNIDNQCAPIKADPTHIHQILMNLLTNAYHAMEESGGELTITLKEVLVDAHQIPVLDLKPGNYACLTVADTGTGVPEEMKEKIFDPFFTTKPKGKGTGLGLSVAHGIVKSTGGTINLFSIPGRGAEFHVYLPIAESSAKKRNQSRTSVKEAICEGNEKILFVDDQEENIVIAEQMLEQLGYQVISYTDSPAALDAFKENPDQFDMVMTDLAMPGMTGDRLAVELLKIRPNISILLCSGLSDQLSKQELLSVGIKGFISKPYNENELFQKIRELLRLKSGSQL